MSSRAPSPERPTDRDPSATLALLTSELAAWRCLRCGSVCCVHHSQPSVCARCGTRYVVHA